MRRRVASRTSLIAVICLGAIAAVTSCLAVGPQVPGRGPECGAVPRSVRLGDFFIVRVSGLTQTANISGRCQWIGRTYVLHPVGNNLEAVLAVPMTTSPGKGTVRVTLDVSSGMRTLSAPVRILKRRFGIQRLTMKKETLALYSAAGVKEEYRAIRTALAIESPDRPWQPPFIRPCDGTIGTSFGVHRITNRTSRSRHRGVDIRAPEGTPVVAANSGVVTLAREDFALHGRTVVIDHGQGLSSLYLHLASIGVAEGQSVQRGETIGTVGASGASTGPHLHWAMYIHDICVDPFSVIRFPWPAPPP